MSDNPCTAAPVEYMEKQPPQIYPAPDGPPGWVGVLVAVVAVAIFALVVLGGPRLCAVFDSWLSEEDDDKEGGGGI